MMHVLLETVIYNMPAKFMDTGESQKLRPRREHHSIWIFGLRLSTQYMKYRCGFSRLFWQLS